jgi:Lon protease-like protein
VSRSIPLFPLPLVLFPGAVQPLHIFEPRYQRMLADCLEGDREFGMLCRFRDVAEQEIPAGTIGCIAHIESTQPLGDGRSNIMVMGTTRFVFRTFVTAGTPYHVGLVDMLSEPEVDPALVSDVAHRVRVAFARVGRAAREMQDDPTPLPELPDDPSLLSFAVAQYIDLDLADKQRLLTAAATDARLQELDALLSPLVGELEQRAFVHGHAKANGKGLGHIAPGP